MLVELDNLYRMNLNTLFMGEIIVIYEIKIIYEIYH